MGDILMLGFALVSMPAVTMLSVGTATIIFGALRHWLWHWAFGTQGAR